MTVDTIKTEVLKLPRLELLELVQFVVEALKKQEQEHVSADELSAAWKTELLRRREEVKNGTTQLFTLQEVQDELNKEFGFDLTISHQS